MSYANSANAPFPIIVDTREQVPWTFESRGVILTRARLDAGDYSTDGLEHRVAIERKSLDDWTGTVMHDRARFYRELDLLRAYDFRCIIVETTIREIESRKYRSKSSPESIIGFIAEIVVSQCVPVYLGGTRAESQTLALAFLKMAKKKLDP